MTPVTQRGGEQCANSFCRMLVVGGLVGRPRGTAGACHVLLIFVRGARHVSQIREKKISLFQQS